MCLLYRGKAPIASMDAMEDMDLLSGSNTHLSKLSSECNMGTATKGIFPGLKYRHIGKSGFKVSNLILGKYLNLSRNRKHAFSNHISQRS